LADTADGPVVAPVEVPRGLLHAALTLTAVMSATIKATLRVRRPLEGLCISALLND
jgi:hypothetical protein